MGKPDPKYAKGEEMVTPSGGVPSPIVQRKFVTWTTDGEKKGAWSYLLEHRFGWYFEGAIERA